MKKTFCRFFFLFFLFAGLCILFTLGRNQKQISSSGRFNLADRAIPHTLFHFIENKGQLPDQVNYHIKMPRGNVFFSDDYIDYQFIIEKMQKNRGVDSTEPNQATKQGTTSLENIRLHFMNSNPDVEILGAQVSQAIFNFYRGNDSRKWVESAQSYQKIVYKELWPLIDLIVFENQGKLKHEYLVKPGGNIRDIKFSYLGVERVSVNNKKQLEVHTRSRILKEDAPVSYQRIDNEQILVSTQYKIEKGKSVGFDVGTYNPEQDLIIDPSLLYSTFLGGSELDAGSDIIIDLQLNAYVVGSTSSPNFPTTPGAYDRVINNSEAFISKLDSTGADLLFSTYFGGSGGDAGSSIMYAWGDDGPVIAGLTSSNDLPTHGGAYDKNLNGSNDVFVAKFTSSGQLRYSTYLGGNDTESSPEIGIDGSDNVFVGGLTQSSDFITTSGVIDNQFDQNQWGDHYNIFITKFNPRLSSLEYSTFLGKDDMDFGGITADYYGNAYVVGSHYGWGDPKITTTPGVYAETYQGEWGEGFITKIDPTGRNLVFSTYMDSGVRWEDKREIWGVDVDGTGNVYIISTYKHDYGPWWDTYVKKYSADGAVRLFNKRLYTEVNHIGNAFPTDIAVDGRGGIYVIGDTNAEEFDVTNDAIQSNLAGDYDLYVVKVNANNGNIIYSTYMGGIGEEYAGGIAADSFESVYITGWTYSQDFPATPEAYSPNYNGKGDGFAARIRDEGPVGKLKLNKDSILITVSYKSTASSSRNITVRNIGKGVVNYAIATDSNWLSVNPDSGDVRSETDTITVTVTPTKKMKFGTHLGIVKVNSLDAYNSPQNLLVKMKIKGPTISLSKNRFSVAAQAGGPNPDSLKFKIRNKGPGKLRYRIQAKNSWLSTSRKQGVSTGEKDEIKIFIDISGMSTGIYQGTIEISAKGSVDPPVIIKVNLTITN